MNVITFTFSLGSRSEGTPGRWGVGCKGSQSSQMHLLFPQSLCAEPLGHSCVWISSFYQAACNRGIGLTLSQHRDLSLEDLALEEIFSSVMSDGSF